VENVCCNLFFQAALLTGGNPIFLSDLALLLNQRFPYRDLCQTKETIYVTHDLLHNLQHITDLIPHNAELLFIKVIVSLRGKITAKFLGGNFLSCTVQMYEF
jgi:hypothetical protein